MAFNQEIADKVCESLKGGLTLRKSCEPHDVAHSTVLEWVKNDVQGFADQYRRAREIGYYVMADAIIDISDESGLDVRVGEGGSIQVDGEAIARAKLRTENRKWLLSKALPKVFGDKTAVEHSGSIDTSPDALKAELLGIAKPDASE